MNCSFVLMSYNQEDFVAEAVTAALAQEGPPLEIILSDDCSQDATFEIMQRVVAGYEGPHQVILRRNEKNLGLIAHFRKMFSECSGDVMIVAWGDDAAMPDRALRIKEVFDTTDAWLVHSHATCVDLEGKVIRPSYLHAEMIRSWNLEKLATSNALLLGATAAYHRKLAEKYGHVTDPRAFEDLVYGFRAALENGDHFIEQPLVRYRVGSGISTKRSAAELSVQRAAHVRRLKTQFAVLSQRRRDARVFGFAAKDRIPTLINESRLQLLFRMYFMGAIHGARYTKMMVRHPVLAFRALQLFLQFQNHLNKTTRP